MKAQVSIEFMILFALLVVIFIVYVEGGAFMQNRNQAIQANVEGRKYADGIASEINSAVDSGAGYGRRFYMDSSFAGITSFNVSIQDYQVVLSWSGGSVSSFITVNNVTGSVMKGWNEIYNKYGVIYVN